MCVRHDVRLVLWTPYATFTALNLPLVPSSPLEVNSAQSCYLCADEQAGWFMYYLPFFFFLSDFFYSGKCMLMVDNVMGKTSLSAHKTETPLSFKTHFSTSGHFSFNCLFDVEYILMCTGQHALSKPLDLENLIHKRECL